MFSSSLLLVLLMLQCYLTSNDEVMTRFCLHTNTYSPTVKATTPAPRQENRDEQHQTVTSSSYQNPEECVEFSFTLPFSKPSTWKHRESRVDCQEHVVMVNTITSLCEDQNIEWLEKVTKAYEWCLIKGYAPKQDSNEISTSQFLDAKTPEDCCYLFSQTPAEVFTTLKERNSSACEQISFQATLQTDCTRNHKSLARGFIRTTYNCLRWAFKDD